jgi:hypothetical protein
MPAINNDNRVVLEELLIITEFISSRMAQENLSEETRVNVFIELKKLFDCFIIEDDNTVAETV